MNNTPLFTSTMSSGSVGASAVNATPQSSTKSTPLTTTSIDNPAKTTTIKQHYICSPFLQTTSSFLLRRRLLLPALVVPTFIFIVPSIIITFLSLLAYNVTFGASNLSYQQSLLSIIISSSSIILSTLILINFGKSTINQYYSSNEVLKKDLLKRSVYALPFWSFVISLVMVRTVVYYYSFGIFKSSGNNYGNDDTNMPRVVAWVVGMITTTFYWSIKIASTCFWPAIGWIVLSLLIVLRYTGPFCPIVRCSSTPLRTNPFDATLHRFMRNFTSKKRFLDMIADGLDKLSAPSSTKPTTKVTTTDSNMKSNDIGGGGNGGWPFTFSSTTATATNITSNGTAPNQQQHQQHQQPKPVPILPTKNNNDNNLGRLLEYLITSTTSYSRPGLLSILCQMTLNAIGGLVLAEVFVLPNVGYEMFDAMAVILSCMLAPVFELVSSIGKAELNYSHYSSVTSSGNGSTQFRLGPVLIALANDISHSVRSSIVGITMLAPVIATVTTLVWSHVGPFLMGEDGLFILDTPSYGTVMHSLFVSYMITVVLMTVVAIQEVLTRWAVCAPGMDADVLMYQAPKEVPPKLSSSDKSSNETFLAEDLIIQSILMGDGTTVDKVITPPSKKQSSSSSMLPFKNHQEDEIQRNEIAMNSFAEYIEQSSTKCSGKLSDDILRLCILESFGGSGGRSSLSRQSFYFGNLRHTAAIRKRLNLSAATASPGQQPIAVPIARALCAFAGGIGDVMSKFYRQQDKNGKPLKKNDATAELWKLPPGCLDAVEFAIIAAARFTVMNSVSIDKHGRASVDPSKRLDRMSLLLPCVLQSAYKLLGGINDYAAATAAMNEVNLKDGKDNGLECYIADKCPHLQRVISACNDSAKMVLKTVQPDVLLGRKWNGGMQRWLLDLNCKETKASPVPQLTN